MARANFSLLTGGDAEPCAWTRFSAHVIVDEVGRLDGEQGLGWGVVPATRLLDTRECSEQWCDGMPAGGVPFDIEIDTSAPAVAITVTAVGASELGYAWAGGSLRRHRRWHTVDIGRQLRAGVLPPPT